LAALQSQPERALRLAGAASALRETIGAPHSSVEQEKLEQMLEPARRVLTDDEQETYRAQGREMSLDQAIEYALSD
jgi:hypothetical protein